MIEITADDGEISLRGLVGRPEDDMAGTRLQHLFVAGRPFRDRSILHAVQEGYRGLLLSGRQPIVFLSFDMPTDMVDVNVHPAKMEVRFREPARLYRLVLSAIRTAFLQHDMGTSLKAPDSPAFAPWFGQPQKQTPSPAPFAPSDRRPCGNRPSRLHPMFPLPPSRMRWPSTVVTDPWSGTWNGRCRCTTAISWSSAAMGSR